MARTPDPTSVTGQLREVLRRGPVDTAEAARAFGKTTAVMSAMLNQMRRRGEARQLSVGAKGKSGKPALWGGPQSTP